MTVAELATAWLKTAYHDDDPRVLRQRREQNVDGYASVSARMSSRAPVPSPSPTSPPTVLTGCSWTSHGRSR
jgi:hypothetical protein